MAGGQSYWESYDYTASGRGLLKCRWAKITAMEYRVLLTAFALFLALLTFGQSSATSPGDADVMRIENEIKLNVPAEAADSLWQYLSIRYTDDNLFLKDIDPSFSSRIEEEFFVDQYFDNRQMQLLEKQIGVRHRTRHVLSNPTDPNNGLQLVQVKVNNNDGDEQSRGEYKYLVKYYGKPDNGLDIHPLFNKLQRDQRILLLERLAGLGVDANTLQPTIRIKQQRDRIYLNRGSEPFATLTLDRVKASFINKKTTFVELELELNEINYTRGDAGQRAEMEQINESIKKDLLTAFPMLQQDQTPKYNKAFAALGLADYSTVSILGVSGGLFFSITLLALILIGLLYYRRERKAWPQAV
jgi:hypothetical protein